jgi:hypothetical protein
MHARMAGSEVVLCVKCDRSIVRKLLGQGIYSDDWGARRSLVSVGVQEQRDGGFIVGKAARGRDTKGLAATRCRRCFVQPFHTPAKAAARRRNDLFT